jgi:hypothetical protein
MGMAGGVEAAVLVDASASAEHELDVPAELVGVPLRIDVSGAK